MFWDVLQVFYLYCNSISLHSRNNFHIPQLKLISMNALRNSINKCLCNLYLSDSFHFTSGGLLFEGEVDIGSGSGHDHSLFQAITCNGTVFQSILSDCSVKEGSCVCQKSIGLRCFGKRLSQYNLMSQLIWL